jgi:hypothetical protein
VVKEEWLQPQNVLTIINILVTGTFSFLVWRATKVGADAAKQTYELNEKIVKNEELTKKALKNEYITTVYMRLLEFGSAVRKQIKELDPHAMERAPKTHGLTDEQRAKYFTKEELNIIDGIWFEIKEYLDKHWTNEDGTFKGWFDGVGLKKMKGDSEVLSQSIDEHITKLYKLSASE